MQSFRLILMSIVTLAMVVPGVAQDVKPDPHEKLDTAIPEGIRLLEAEQYRAFVKSFVSPNFQKVISEKTSLDEFAKEFGEGKASRLLEVLKEIKDAKPEFDETGTKATFSLKKAISGMKSITFLKIEKHWYIEN